MKKFKRRILAVILAFCTMISIIESSHVAVVAKSRNNVAEAAFPITSPKIRPVGEKKELYYTDLGKLQKNKNLVGVNCKCKNSYRISIDNPADKTIASLFKYSLCQILGKYVGGEVTQVMQQIDAVKTDCSAVENDKMTLYVPKTVFITAYQSSPLKKLEANLRRTIPDGDGHFKDEARELSDIYAGKMVGFLPKAWKYYEETGTKNKQKIYYNYIFFSGEMGREVGEKVWTEDKGKGLTVRVKKKNIKDYIQRVELIDRKVDKLEFHGILQCIKTTQDSREVTKNVEISWQEVDFIANM